MTISKFKRPAPLIAGNWKMNLTISEAVELVDGIRFGLPFPGQVDVLVAPTFLCLNAVAERLKKSYIQVAGQDLFYEDNGAFTGQCSGKYIRDAGAGHVLIGHSERRQYFGETDGTVNKKIEAALRNRLIPIVCVGETLEERERGDVETVIQRQVTEGFRGFAGSDPGTFIIAYEPVWAIGTGKTATPAQVNEVHGFIRRLLVSMYGESVAYGTRILYGGSVKPSNAKELMSLPEVDGALVGGASLKVGDFIDIIKNAEY